MFRFFAKKIINSIVMELEPNKIYMMFLKTQKEADAVNELFTELFRGMKEKPKVVIIVGDEVYSKIKVVTIE